MQTVHDQILERLGAIEREHHVRIPLAVESGSRAWGFASPDSDYDCRFVYVRPRDAYLTVFGIRDTIDYEPDAIFDVNGWDVRKVIQHLVRSNAVMLEWLSSGVVYRSNEAVLRELWRVGQAFFSPVASTWHYLSMARNKLGEIGAAGEQAKLKHYCYVLRPLACIRFIREQGTVPAMAYRTNLEAIDAPEKVRAEIERMIEQKQQAQEIHTIAPNATLLAYFTEEIAQAEAWLSTHRKEPAGDTSMADECFRRILEYTYADA